VAVRQEVVPGDDEKILKNQGHRIYFFWQLTISRRIPKSCAPKGRSFFTIARLQ
jgi:hypothetical protein